MALLERLARETWEVERKLKVGERDREEEMEDERIQLTEAKKQVDQLGAEVGESSWKETTSTLRRVSIDADLDSLGGSGFVFVARLEELLEAQPEPTPVLPS